MLYRFAGAELDCARRELRVGTTHVPLQPQAFAVLQYLLEHRERVVPKAELLAALWPGVHVGDASLQRAISLARSALNDAGILFRTHSKHGYRFSAEVTVDDARPPRGGQRWLRPALRAQRRRVHRLSRLRSRRARHRARAGLGISMQGYFELPAMRAAVESLAELGRVICFDKRGTGLSDRIRLMAPLDQRVDDLRAVLDAVGSKRAILVGFSEAGPLVGSAIDVARAIAAHAAPAQVLVSSVVRDLVCSPSLVLEEQGHIPLPDGRAVAVLTATWPTPVPSMRPAGGNDVVFESTLA